MQQTTATQKQKDHIVSILYSDACSMFPEAFECFDSLRSPETFDILINRAEYTENCNLVQPYSFGERA